MSPETERDGTSKATRPSGPAAYLVPAPSSVPRPALICGLLATVLIVVGVVVGSEPYVAPLICVVLAGLAAWYLYQRTPTDGIGVEISDDTVRLGRWPGHVVTLNRAEITSVDESTSPWHGPRPGHGIRAFVLPDYYYLTVRAGSGRTYQVAFDKNPSTGRVSDAAAKVLRHLTASLSEPTEPDDAHRPLAGSPPDARTSDHAADNHRADRLWDSAMARHDEVLAAYAPYEMDPVTALTYPAISDVSVPETADFFEALADATALRPEDPASAGAILEQYRAAVRRLTQTWRTAERKARQVGTDLLADDDARRLRQATKLLGHAEGAANAAERASYLRGARELIERLIERGAITAPPRVIEQIEASTALAIEAARRDG
ncbi:hypothetical protein EK0264_17160 [Epidermidibacterium keratini]|uniref:Uncharacterized protein n=1 Tax=Epidermidibacterium keratini TaxID=1891644 RepID=A0A7L4YTI4_9ACTN|nr:hypothetical protein [Epidermidibacterium keratini]QHC01837.1 hypothetical protein EK0264_17160 [Epidermidibacterium keratini]